MAHPNEDLLRRGYEAFGSGDMDTVLAILDADIVWHEGGSNQITGDYHGHQEVMGFFGKQMELSGGSFSTWTSTTSWPMIRTALHS